MTSPISIANAPHYTWGAACDGWHLVRGEGLSVIEERMPAGTSEARHRHGRARQFFYVLAGSLRIERDGEIIALGTGAGLEIAPSAAHQVFCDGPDEARFLVVSQPPSHGDREPA